MSGSMLSRFHIFILIAALAVSCSVFYNGMAFAVTVQSVSPVGGLVHGQNISIGGALFGEKYPVAPLWWDDGEGATANSLIPRTGEINHVISTLTGTNKHYNDAHPFAVTENDGYSNIRYRSDGFRNVSVPHSRSTKFIGGCHDDQGECLGNEVGQNVGLTIGDTSRHSTWYASYYLRLDPLWPKGTTQNYKFTNWEMGSPQSGIYSTPFCYDNTNGCGCGPEGSANRSTPGCGFDHWSGATVVQILNTDLCSDGWSAPNCGAPFVTQDTNKHNPLNQWVRQEHIFDYNTNRYWFGVDNAEFWDTANKVGCVFDKSRYPNQPSGITIGGFWKEGMCGNSQDDLNDNACRYFDDIYVDNTFSRVMLCNNATYESASMCEPQIPSIWGNGAITARVNQGKLPQNGRAYLFVFDAANNRNPIGYCVPLGSGSCTSGVTPGAPGNPR